AMPPPPTLPARVQLVTVSVPRLRMPAAPLLMVSPETPAVTPGLTWKMAKAPLTFARTDSTAAPGPRTSTLPLRAGRAEARLMVPAAPAPVKRIRSPPGGPLASLIACRSAPLSPSLRLLTKKSVGTQRSSSRSTRGRHRGELGRGVRFVTVRLLGSDRPRRVAQRGRAAPVDGVPVRRGRATGFRQNTGNR